MNYTKEFEIATWAAIFILFTNLGAIAKQFHGVPGVVAGSFALLLLIPLGYHVLLRHQKLIFDHTLGLMFVFLAVCIISAIFAKDPMLSLNWAGEFFLEGIVLYFLLINVIRNFDAMKRVLWVLMIAGGLVGGLSVIQETTGTYDKQYGGLAQRNIESWTGESNVKKDGMLKTRTKVGRTNRASGPIGDPNRYAQNMLLLLPLAAFMLLQIRQKRTVKIVAAITVGLIFSGILLTYSRGAFLTLVFLGFALMILKYIKIKQTLIGLLVVVILVAVVSPGYFVRMQSILGVEAFISETTVSKPDAVTRGRLTEMMAAFNAFLDHPIVGVGPRHYSKYYSIEYMDDPSIALRQINKSRRAHTLYSELAAETGILGFSVFMAIIFMVLLRLQRARQYWRNVRPEYAHLATACMLSILSYMSTAIFLHFSFQRYFWLFLALAGVCIHILETAKMENSRQNYY